MSKDFTRIPNDALTGQVGKCVHLQGAPKGCVWRLVRVMGGYALIETPKTRRGRIVSVDRLLYTRANTPQEPRT